ncbi:hypothetical protein XCR1_3200005 [Xenorhabdus cabanillasii JM26]|uniref:Uncharacterized protein n=1 Tax=Xenorhabdus cabanillasii JM26 TaxID=1427517 RepID=W1J6Q0_9GAMM|nr:hypothetical protein XCR1_3200005 [Xenorhabdus cabanillasii JM26]
MLSIVTVMQIIYLINLIEIAEFLKLFIYPSDTKLMPPSLKTAF